MLLIFSSNSVMQFLYSIQSSPSKLLHRILVKRNFLCILYIKGRFFYTKIIYGTRGKFETPSDPLAEQYFLMIFSPKVG